MRRFWIIISIVCIVLAGVAFWMQRTNVAFVAATLGAVTWFVNCRNQIRESLPAPDPLDDEEIDETNET